MKDLQQRLSLSLLFITHDLGVARSLCDRVAVMYLGQIVEQAPVEQLFERPRHPYTRALLAASPRVHMFGRRRERIQLSGELPSPIHPPGGCRFHTRCPYAVEVCSQQAHALEPAGEGHMVACHLPLDVEEVMP